MNAAVAAIVASAITAAVALGVGLLAPYLTARHAREAKLLEMQRDIFVEAINILYEAAGSSDVQHLRAVHAKMAGVDSKLILLTNDDLANLYGLAMMALASHTNAIEADLPLGPTVARILETQDAFMKAARGFMALPEPPS